MIRAFEIIVDNMLLSLSQFTYFFDKSSLSILLYQVSFEWTSISWIATMLKQNCQCRQNEMLEKNSKVILHRRCRNRVLIVRKRLVENLELDVGVRHHSHLDLINRRLSCLDSALIITTNLQINVQLTYK